MDAHNDDQKPVLQPIEDLEREPPHETTLSIAVEDLAGFGELEKREQHCLYSMNELCTEPDTL